MNPVILYLASGEALYAGAALLLLTILGSPAIRHRWLVRLRNLLAWAALAMITFAGPPLSPWLIALFLAAFLAWFIAFNFTPATATTSPPPPRWVRPARLITASLLPLLLLSIVALELPHRFFRLPPNTPRAQHLTVIGDSLSAGIDTSRHLPWPILFHDLTGIYAKNLSQPGALITDGPDLAADLAPDDSLILIELGGNDLIANVPAADFERGLDATLAAIAAPGLPRTIIMYELPLLPHKVAYGRIQRRLAARYRAALIPRRYFTQILNGADATSDGLHLAPAGTRHMAQQVARLLAPALPPTKNSP